MWEDAQGIVSFLDRFPSIGHVLELFSFVILWIIYRSGERGRKALHDRINVHEDSCQDRAEKDAKWKGKVEGKLDMESPY